MVDTVTNAEGLGGAAAIFLNALRAYAAGEADVGDLGLAGQGLVSALGSFIASNSTLESEWGVAGVPLAIGSLNTDITNLQKSNNGRFARSIQYNHVYAH